VVLVSEPQEVQAWRFIAINIVEPDLALAGIDAKLIELTLMVTSYYDGVAKFGQAII
jgi:hypothetical protein